MYLSGKSAESTIYKLKSVESSISETCQSRIESIDNLKSEIAHLKSEIAHLKSEIDHLKSEIDNLKSAIVNRSRLKMPTSEIEDSTDSRL